MVEIVPGTPADDVPVYGDAEDFTFTIPEQPKSSRAKPGAKDTKTASGRELADIVKAVGQGLSRLPDQEHWAISDDEASSVAEPLARVLARKGKASRWMSKHIDGVLLTFAACAITLPRVAISLSGAKTSGTPVREHQHHSRPSALDRLLNPNAVGTDAGVTRTDVDAHVADGAENGRVAGPTADALRDALGGITG